MGSAKNYFYKLFRHIKVNQLLYVVLLFSNNSFPQLPDFSSIVENITPSVVSITVVVEDGFEHPVQTSVLPTGFEDFEFMGEGSSQILRDQHVHNGTGVVLTADGYIVTNQHIVQGGESYRVTLANGFQYAAELIGSDRVSDLAVLKIQAENLQAGVFNESEESIKAGQSILGFGSPYSLSGSVTQGIISYVNRPLPIMGIDAHFIVFIQTNLLINPGNSGGPVVDHNGEIIGINSRLLSDSGGSSGVAFAIPATVVKNITDQLICNGYASRGWIGVAVRNVPSSAAVGLGLATPKGALVTAITEGSPAQVAGIQVNDVIVAVNHNVIDNRYDLTYRIGLLNSTNRTHLIVIRDRKYHSTVVVPDELVIEGI
ncbi:trypsin-like peptidase domain-containing protein [Haliea sp. AH-315-K21]|nr:trypsin-like peptidase domain-containing protein [Haliea sp. AH-315-K21]